MKVTGKSKVNDSPVLNQKFWIPGRSISGVVVRHVNTSNGPIMEVRLDKPLVIKADPKKKTEARTISHVILGNQRGLQMCAEDAGVAFPFPLQCHVSVKATGVQKTGKGNDMTLFDVEFDLPDAVSGSDIDDAWDSMSV